MTIQGGRQERPGFSAIGGIQDRSTRSGKGFKKKLVAGCLLSQGLPLAALGQVQELFRVPGESPEAVQVGGHGEFRARCWRRGRR